MTFRDTLIFTVITYVDHSLNCLYCNSWDSALKEACICIRTFLPKTGIHTLKKTSLISHATDAID